MSGVVHEVAAVETLPGSWLGAPSESPDTVGQAVWSDERLARAALTHCCEAGSPSLGRMVAAEGPVAVWQALRSGRQDSAWAGRARALALDELVVRSRQAGVRFVIPGDEEWPSSLEVLDHVEVQGLGGAPLGLWLRGPGHLARWSERSLALVGSRASSPYGEQVATDLALDLADDGPGGGWTIVSGGAYGIDGAAHRAAIAAEGRTLAVLASGLDQPYPRGNQRLFDRLAEQQLLVSEVPVGLRPTKVGFLARNRLIAALSVGTVVVEAAARSGANNTASWALECGRELMAVPGPVHSALSVTPHRLIRDHRATLVSDRTDVLALVESLADAPRLSVGGPGRLLDGLDPTLLAVREVLPGRGAMSTGEVAGRAGLAVPVVLASLGQLQQLGLVHHDEQGEWRISRPSRSRGDGD